MQNTPVSAHDLGASNFLDLPAPIRRQIYELLPVHTKHVVGLRDASKGSPGKPVIILVLHYVERSIIQTCRKITAEAEPILEIEAMRLGPPQLIVTGEYWDKIPEYLHMLRMSQDTHIWQRLRIRDEDREGISSEITHRLLWARISTLSLLSFRSVQIGVFVSRASNRRAILSSLRRNAKPFLAPHWWERSDICHPHFEVILETEWKGPHLKGGFADQAIKILIDEGLFAKRGRDQEEMNETFGVGSFAELFHQSINARFDTTKEPRKNVGRKR